MKFAIICPIEPEESDNPDKINTLIYGGAEKLHDEMLENLNKFSENEFDLICIRCNFLSFWGIIDAYKNFFDLDLSKYEGIIVTKTGSWMARSKKKIVYMLHPQRRLYDLYEPKKIAYSDRIEIKNIESKINNNKGFLEVYYELIKNKEIITALKLDKDNSAFMKKVLHYFDSLGLNECQDFFALSKTVKNRKEYYPKEKEVKVLYPCIEDKKYTLKSYQNFLFTTSRLNDLKRIDLLIKAFKKIKDKKIKFKIAGTGENLNKLKELAKGDKRIEFLGFISEKEKLKYYSECLFVPFIPFNEDFGFITLEAMKSKKAVLTCSDSGGPTELVNPGFNGLIAKPEVKDITAKMNYLIKNKKNTILLGENGFHSVKDINWKNFIKELGFKIEPHPKNSSKEIIVVNSYAVNSEITGGQIRIKQLLSNLSKEFNINLINLAWPNKNQKIEKVNNNFNEINIDLDNNSVEKVTELNKKFYINVDDVYRLDNMSKNKEYSEILKENCSNEKILICEHPYMYNYLKNLKRKKLIYESHNVEYLMKKQIFGNSEIEKKFLKNLFESERELCKKSDAIIAVCSEDKEKFSKLYNLNPEKIFIIPNGVDCNNISPISNIEKEQIKKELGLERKNIGIFIGSYHKPNLEALLKIIPLAKTNPNIIFFIIGEVILNYIEIYGENLPINVIAFGKLDHAQKQILLKSADFAINPMFSGGGSNLKILEYLAAGLPVITTEFGARGINISEVDLVFMDDKTKKIDLQKLYKINKKKNREYVKKEFNWENLGEKYINILNIISNKTPV